MKLEQLKINRSIDLMRELKDIIQKQDTLAQNSPYIHIEFGTRNDTQHLHLNGEDTDNPAMQACFSSMKEHIYDMFNKRVNALLEELKELGVTFS